MIKRVFTVAATFLSAITLTACSLTARDIHEVTHRTEIPPKMLFLGDSIPAGYGLDGYSKDDLYQCRSYPNILAEKYEKEIGSECGHEMTNKAVSGATSYDLLELVNSGTLDDDLSDCDAIVISIGGNDLLGLIFDLFNEIGYSPDSGSFDYKKIDILGAADKLTSMSGKADDALAGFETNLPKITDAISSRTDAVLYVQTLYDPLEYYSSIPKIPEFSAQKIGKLNDIIREHSVGVYSVVDVAERFEGQADIVTNIKDFDIHPNYLGHQLIADEIDEAFRVTGFSYTTEEYGEQYLTRTGYAAIIAGVVLGAIALSAPVFIVGRTVKKEKEE